MYQIFQECSKHSIKCTKHTIMFHTMFFLRQNYRLTIIPLTNFSQTSCYLTSLLQDSCYCQDTRQLTSKVYFTHYDFSRNIQGLNLIQLSIHRMSDSQISSQSSNLFKSLSIPLKISFPYFSFPSSLMKPSNSSLFILPATA